MAERTIQSFTWLEMDSLHRHVATMIRDERFVPDIIVGILRCGMVSAVHLAYLLSVDTIRVLYVRTTPSDEILVAKTIEPTVELDESLNVTEGKKVLVVDVVMASGTTMILSLKVIRRFNPVEVKTAVIVDWPTSPYKLKLGKRPTIDFIGTTVDKWPEFPWEH